MKRKYPVRVSPTETEQRLFTAPFLSKPVQLSEPAGSHSLLSLSVAVLSFSRCKETERETLCRENTLVPLYSAALTLLVVCVCVSDAAQRAGMGINKSLMYLCSNEV